MNATQFCEKYGKKFASKIPKWYEAGYLGNSTKDKKTGEYNIPNDIPLPYSANANVSTMPTLMRDILLAASECCSLYSEMYPKIPKDSFDRMLHECIEASLICVCYSESGDWYLQLTPTGVVFLDGTTKEERKTILDNVYKLIMAGSTLITALVTTWPLIQSAL